MSRHIIKKRAAFADIHQSTIGSELHIFSVKYVKKDGTVGYKAQVSKSFKQLPGASKYRSNVKLNNALILHDHIEKSFFQISADLILEYNNKLIDHL